MFKDYLLFICVLFCISGCYYSNKELVSNDKVCPVTEPLFTDATAKIMVSQLRSNLFYYSPYGNAGYTDVYLGSAYFVGATYAKDAVLLPTVSPVIRHGTQEIYDYFTKFLIDGPILVAKNGGDFVTLSGCGYGVVSGYYKFLHQGNSDLINARYTLQFQYQPFQSEVSVIVESGINAGKTIKVNQPIGWYIRLQNSSKLSD